MALRILDWNFCMMTILDLFYKSEVVIQLVLSLSVTDSKLTVNTSCAFYFKAVEYGTQTILLPKRTLKSSVRWPYLFVA
jgi:hypothetical protein